MRTQYSVWDAKRKLDKQAQKERAEDYLDIDGFNVLIDIDISGIESVLVNERQGMLVALKAIYKTATGRFLVDTLIKQQIINEQEVLDAKGVAIRKHKGIVDTALVDFFKSLFRMDAVNKTDDTAEAEKIADGLVHISNFVLNSHSDDLLILNVRTGVFESADNVFHGFLYAIFRSLGFAWSTKLSTEIQMRIKLMVKRVSMDAFNKQVVNFGNGYGWDLENDVIRKVTAADLSVTSLGVIPQKGKTQEWEQALLRVFDGDKETAEQFEFSLAASLDYHSRRANQMYWLYGQSGNGKSTMLSVLTHILGFSNLAPMNVSELNKDFELANLVNDAGVIVMAVLGEENERVLTETDITNIKRLSEGKAMAIRRKNKSTLQVKSVNAALIQSFNNLPLMGGEPAVIRRTILFPFTVNLSEQTEMSDPNIGKKLREEAPAVAYRLLHLLPELRRNNYVVMESPRMKSLKSEWAEQTGAVNPVDKFVEEFIVIDGEASLTKPDVYKLFQTNVTLRGEYTSAQRFNKKFIESVAMIHQQIIRATKSNGREMYHGIAIKK